MTICRYCGRRIVHENGAWIDPEATGDDSVWRETCDAHDTFTAEHEPGSPGLDEMVEQGTQDAATAIIERYS